MRARSRPRRRNAAPARPPRPAKTTRRPPLSSIEATRTRRRPMPDSVGPPPPNSELLVYQTEEGQSRVQVRLDGGTVWMTQLLMADLYQTTKQNISLHIQN